MRRRERNPEDAAGNDAATGNFLEKLVCIRARGKAALLRSPKKGVSLCERRVARARGEGKAALLRSPKKKEERMKYRTIAMVIASLLFSLPTWAANAPSSGFASLKSLAGQWEAKDEKGNPAITTWKLVSGGSALMEEMPHDGMVTMYHMDNNRLLMTHYCSSMNQPRMQAEVSPDGRPSFSAS
jgi:hypothetical protein